MKFIYRMKGKSNNGLFMKFIYRTKKYTASVNQ